MFDFGIWPDRADVTFFAGSDCFWLATPSIKKKLSRVMRLKLTLSSEYQNDTHLTNNYCSIYNI